MFYLRTLDDTAWSIADVTGPIGTGTHIFDINFTANDQEYNSIRFVDGVDSGKIYFNATLVNEYPQGGWVDAAYQSVKIAGGVDATNPSLLSWFRQNAKNLTPSNDDASITQALQNIAEAISGGGSGGGLPDPSEASAGDVLSLDEDKKPTWAPASGGLPENYPFESATIFSHTYTIGGGEPDQTYEMSDAMPENWFDTASCFVDGIEVPKADYPSSFYLFTEDKEIVVNYYDPFTSGSGNPEMYLAYWINNEPADGNHSVIIQGIVVEQNFKAGVEAIGSTLPVVIVKNYSSQLSCSHSFNELTKIFTKPCTCYIQGASASYIANAVSYASDGDGKCHVNYSYVSGSYLMTWEITIDDNDNMAVNERSFTLSTNNPEQ